MKEWSYTWLWWGWNFPSFSTRRASQIKEWFKFILKVQWLFKIHCSRSAIKLGGEKNPSDLYVWSMLIMEMGPWSQHVYEYPKPWFRRFFSANISAYIVDLLTLGWHKNNTRNQRIISGHDATSTNFNWKYAPQAICRRHYGSVCLTTLDSLKFGNALMFIEDSEKPWASLLLKRTLIPAK